MKTPGEIAFEAYWVAFGGASWEGRGIPTWQELSDQHRNAWEVAVLAGAAALDTEE